MWVASGFCDQFSMPTGVCRGLALSLSLDMLSNDDVATRGYHPRTRQCPNVCARTIIQHIDHGCVCWVRVRVWYAFQSKLPVSLMVCSRSHVCGALAGGGGAAPRYRAYSSTPKHVRHILRVPLVVGAVPVCFCGW